MPQSRSITLPRHKKEGRKEEQRGQNKRNMKPQTYKDLKILRKCRNHEAKPSRDTKRREK